jgi:outer membrane protein TolC
MLALPAWGEVLTLEQALARAEQASPVVQQARLRALEQEAQSLVARSGLGPQLGIAMSQTYQTSNLQGIGLTFPGIPSRIGPYRVMDARPRLTQTVLDLSLLSRYRAERERIGQAKEEAGTVGEKTRLAVIDLYLQALLAGSQARAAAARVETAQAVLNQVTDAEQAGTGNKLDVARATQRLETERAAMIRMTRNKQMVVTMLKRTIGAEQGEAVEVAAIVAAEPAAASLETALQTRLEMRALEARGRALREELRAAERERWPKVGAFGDWGALGQDPTNAVSTYMVGVSVNVPVWTSGRIENGVKSARQRLAQWEQEKRALVLQVEQEIAQAQVEREAARAALSSSAKAAAAAREALELSRLRYGAGLATNLDVVTAQGEVSETEEEEQRTRYETLVATARLAAAQGDVMAFVRGR